MSLKEYDPAQRYFLVAGLIGVPTKPNAVHSGCAGHAVMHKVREP